MRVATTDFLISSLRNHLKLIHLFFLLKDLTEDNYLTFLISRHQSFIFVWEIEETSKHTEYLTRLKLFIGKIFTNNYKWLIKLWFTFFIACVLEILVQEPNWMRHESYVYTHPWWSRKITVKGRLPTSDNSSFITIQFGRLRRGKNTDLSMFIYKNLN